jgi:hypothetical protein
MSLGVLLNIFDTILNQTEASHLVRSKKILNGQTAFEILLELYKTKEALVLVAENAQEDEFNQLNQQIETQNVDNSTIMNCTHLNSFFTCFYSSFNFLFSVEFSDSQSRQTHGRPHSCCAHSSPNWLHVDHKRETKRFEQILKAREQAERVVQRYATND